MKKLIFLLLVFFLSINAQFKNTALNTKFDRSILNKIQTVYEQKNTGKASDQMIKQNYSTKEIPIDDNSRLLVRLNVKSKSIKNQLAYLGCEIKNEGWNELYVWVPFDKFEALAEYDDVKSIVLIPQVTTRTLLRPNTKATQSIK